MVCIIYYSIKSECIDKTLCYLKPGIASMKVSSFRLNGFNNAANNRVSFFVASFNSFLRQNQTSFVFSLIFSNKVLQWVSKMFVLVIRRDQLHQIYIGFFKMPSYLETCFILISWEVCCWPIVMQRDI